MADASVNPDMPDADGCRRLALPSFLVARGVSLRPESDADLVFLERLYTSTRQEELAPVPWSEADKEIFLKSQFSLQRRHYRTFYDDAAFDIVEQNFFPIGRLYLLRGQRDYRIVDISLMPEHRRQGIGAALLTAVQEEAAAAGCIVSIHVEIFNPAQHLYQRLGFQPVEDKQPYRLMEWRHGAVSPSIKEIT